MFFLGTPVSSTTYHWLGIVNIAESDKNQNSNENFSCKYFSSFAFACKISSKLSGCCVLTLPMLRLLLSKAQERKDYFSKPFKPCHVGIYWKALPECSRMSTYVPGFQSGFCIKIVGPLLDTTGMNELTYRLTGMDV